MIHERKKPRMDAAAGVASPLGVMVGAQDQSTMEMVRQAIDKKRLRLAYQPVVLARDPNIVAFYEGLVRLLDSGNRVIPAKDFITQVETNALGRQLDCIALEMGIAALVQNPALRLSINMSARSIGFQDWKGILRHGLTRHPSIASRLILEISESSAMIAPDVVVAFMDEFQRDGIAIALDNFGSGHMAIRYFREFYFDIVKIDRQFTRGIDQDPDGQAIVAALISMSKHFNMFTVAEAVETVAEAEALRDLGVDCFQGYLFGAPSLKSPP